MTISIKENNNKYLEATLALREELEGGFLILAERLKKIRDERIWAQEYESYEGFLREMRISAPTASKLVGVYEKFVVMGGVDPKELIKQGWTNLSIFLPKIKTKEDAIEIFNKVALLDRTDAMRTYQEMKLGVDMATCDHSDSYILKVCRTCGIRLEHHE